MRSGIVRKSNGRAKDRNAEELHHEADGLAKKRLAVEQKSDDKQ